MTHRSNAPATARINIADMYEQVHGEPCPDPNLSIPTQLARTLAVELVERADRAEGYEGPHGFVTRWEVLAKLDYLTARVEQLEVVRES